MTINSEIREAIIEEGGIDVYKCYQCGKCMSACPWYMVENVVFPTYRIPQLVRLGAIMTSEEKEELEKEVTEIYRCVGCENCVKFCPRGVSLPDVIRAIRRILVDYGSYPQELKSLVTRIKSNGNPLGEPRSKRADWAKSLGVDKFTSDMEFVYFPCCMPAYDTRLKNIAESTVKILKHAGVSFGIIGEEETCCCEAIRRVGAEKVYEEAKKSNIEIFKKLGVRKILVTSPHCYTVFKNDYKNDYDGFEVYHTVEIFYKLIKEGRIKPKKSINKRVVYHDPCTLGRQNGIYDEPREVLKSIPNLELLEIENFSREFSLCCGGGSGGVFMDWPSGERIGDVRVKQAIDTGADILAVACPYCLMMFEASVKTMEEEIEVKDISELLAEAIE